MKKVFFSAIIILFLPQAMVLAAAIENNLQKANAIIMANLIANSTAPTATDTGSLEEIAYQPGYTGGAGVFMARAYLRKIIIDHYIGNMRSGNISNVLNSEQSPHLLVYPSPIANSQKLTIELNNKMINSVALYDVTGKLAMPVFKNIRSSVVRMDCGSLAPGVYHVKIISTNESESNVTVNKL